jgi:hypothetical protein
LVAVCLSPDPGVDSKGHGNYGRKSSLCYPMALFQPAIGFVGKKTDVTDSMSWQRFPRVYRVPICGKVADLP